MPRRTRRPKVSSGALDLSLLDALEDFLDVGPAFRSGSRRAAARADLLEVAQALPCARGRDLAEVYVVELTTPELRAGFAAYAAGRARETVARAQATWRALCSHLVFEDVVDSHLMEGLDGPDRWTEPKGTTGPDVAARLLEEAWQGSFSHGGWSERDIAVVASLCVTGLRLSEVLSLRTDSIVGSPGRRSMVVSAAGITRALPIWPSYDAVLTQYLESRATRIGPPGAPGDDSGPLFLESDGTPLTRRMALGLLSRLGARAGLVPRVAPWTLAACLQSTFASTANGRPASFVEAAQVLRSAGVHGGLSSGRLEDRRPEQVDVTLRGAEVSHRGVDSEDTSDSGGG
ncbi:MAG: tyrosine-type recombinase/integrase [Acidimicrobiia bacterium]